MASINTKEFKNIMRVDAGINGDAQYIEQITWILFLKAFDYNEGEWELLEDDYYPIIPEKYRYSTWAESKEGITGDTLNDHISEMFKDLANLDLSFDPKNRKWLVKTTIAGANNFIKSGTTLRKLINKINEAFDFNNNKESHVFNTVYESMLKDLQSAGKSGEFYTPRPVTNFVVEKVAPKLGEKVLDPACGTGGFLTSVMEHYGKIESTEDYKTIQQSLQGIEKKPFPYLLAVTNLLTHGIDVPNISHDNTLRTSCSEYTTEDLVDIIVTNPPFGGAEEKTIANSVPQNLRNTETADLFLVHIIARLKAKGRCGLVLPDGFLFGDGVKASIKKHLMEECNLHTIIRLPKSVFAPYTGINTNLLFFDKGQRTENTWYYRLEMPEDYKNFSKTKPMQDSHFNPVREWWANRKESDNAQLISIDTIKEANYNLDFCGYPHEEVEILSTEELIANYKQDKARNAQNIDNVLASITKAMQIKE